MMSTTRMIAAAVALSAAAVAVTPASAMPTVKQGVTVESPLVQQVAWWNKKKCKNVKKVRAEDTVTTRWHQRTGVPVSCPYVLMIGPVNDAPRRQGQSATLGLEYSLHIVRGHFATYTEDKPLFGIPGLFGTFWIPDHVRGNPERGIRDKSYDVDTGS